MVRKDPAPRPGADGLPRNTRESVTPRSDHKEDRDDPPRGRVKYVKAQADRQPGSRVRVTVEVAYADRVHVAEAEGIGTDTIEMRLAALATLEAIHEVTDTPQFRFVGVKRMHAFDADVVLVALRDPDAMGSRYIGAVAVRSTHVAAAAAAVMDATNRVLFQREEVEDAAALEAAEAVAEVAGSVADPDTVRQEPLEAEQDEGAEEEEGEAEEEEEKD